MENTLAFLNPIWMVIIDSIPVAGVLSIVGWFLRDRISGFFTHKQNIEIEHLKSRLSEQENISSDLRSFALESISSRRPLLIAKRIEAAERIWSATTQLASLSGIAEMIDGNASETGFKTLSETAARHQSVQDSYKIAGEVYDVDATMGKVKNINPGAVRPFVSELAWAQYSAYNSIICWGVFRQKLLETGSPENLTMGGHHMKGLLEIALPNDQKLFEKGSEIGFSIVLEKLQQEILLEVRKNLRGEDETEDEIRKAFHLNETIRKVESKQILSKALHPARR